MLLQNIKQSKELFLKNNIKPISLDLSYTCHAVGKNNNEIMERAYVSKWEGKTGVIRQLSYRECLRLMGFKDDFKIVVNDQNMYRQSGNSIVVNVLMCIVEQIIATGVWDDLC